MRSIMRSLLILLAVGISSCAAQAWYQIPGAATDISAKGNELWVINTNQQIYRWNGFVWELKPGAAVRVGASPDGYTWVVNSGNYIYRWNLVNGNWDLMPGRLVQINAISKDRAIGVNSADQIYLWENNAWRQLPGAAVWAAIGDGDERWVVNRQKMIYRWNLQTNTWDRMPGAAVNIDVQNPCRVIVTNEFDQIYTWYNNNWVGLSGAGKRSTINEVNFFTVNNADQIFIGK